MTTFRIGEAAELLSVSADTVRRWVDAGRLTAGRDENGHRVIGGADLAAFARGQSADATEGITSFLEKRPAHFSDRVSDGLPEIMPWWVEPEFE